MRSEEKSIGEAAEMRKDAETIIRKVIEDVMPDKAVLDSISQFEFRGRVYVAAVGKAAWIMAQAAADFLGERLEKGVIVTKYEHSRGAIERFEIIEAGHPTPDQNSVRGAKAVIALMEEATCRDTVLLLLSGGGSSLLELPMPGLKLEDIQQVTAQMLRSGAHITEINVLRKKMSAIKGGKLAAYIRNARAYSVILSDVIGNSNDMIASGLTYPDAATPSDVKKVVDKYGLELDERIKKALFAEQTRISMEIENHVVGSVGELCQSAAVHAGRLGYTPYILSTTLQCEAKEAGKWIASMVDAGYGKPYAVIAGGETVVKVKGGGIGGRNQELALSAADELRGRKNVLLFSLGSDGTDGPTDAAGGIVDGNSAENLEKRGISIETVLDENDSYHALQEIDGLIFTGATGTNVNDVTVLLCR